MESDSNGIENLQSAIHHISKSTSNDTADISSIKSSTNSTSSVEKTAHRSRISSNMSSTAAICLFSLDYTLHKNKHQRQLNFSLAKTAAHAEVFNPSPYRSIVATASAQANVKQKNKTSGSNVKRKFLYFKTKLKKDKQKVKSSAITADDNCSLHSNNNQKSKSGFRTLMTKRKEIPQVCICPPDCDDVTHATSSHVDLVNTARLVKQNNKVKKRSKAHMMLKRLRRNHSESRGSLYNLSTSQLIATNLTSKRTSSSSSSSPPSSPSPLMNINNNAVNAENLSLGLPSHVDDVTVTESMISPHNDATIENAITTYSSQSSLQSVATVVMSGTSPTVSCNFKHNSSSYHTDSCDYSDTNIGKIKNGVDKNYREKYRTKDHSVNSNKPVPGFVRSISNTDCNNKQSSSPWSWATPRRKKKSISKKQAPQRTSLHQ